MNYSCKKVNTQIKQREITPSESHLELRSRTTHCLRMQAPNRLASRVTLSPLSILWGLGGYFPRLLPGLTGLCLCWSRQPWTCRVAQDEGKWAHSHGGGTGSGSRGLEHQVKGLDWILRHPKWEPQRILSRVGGGGGGAWKGLERSWGPAREDSRPGSGGVSGIGQREAQVNRRLPSTGGAPTFHLALRVSPSGSHWPSVL